MKNNFKLFGIIAMVAVIGFSVISCGNNDSNDDGPVRITVTGLENYNGWVIEVYLSDGYFWAHGYPEERIANGSGTADLLDTETELPFTRTGLFFVGLELFCCCYGDAAYYVTANRVNIIGGSQTIPFSAFIPADEWEEFGTASSNP